MITLHTLKVAAKGLATPEVLKALRGQLSKSRNLLDDLYKMNYFLLRDAEGTYYHPTPNDAKSIFSTILQAHGIDILDKLYKLKTIDYPTVVAVSNAYVRDELSKLGDSELSVVLVNNPLNPEEYGNKKDIKMQSADFTQHQNTRAEDRARLKELKEKSKNIREDLSEMRKALKSDKMKQLEKEDTTAYGVLAGLGANMAEDTDATENPLQWLVEQYIEHLGTNNKHFQWAVNNMGRGYLPVGGAGGIALDNPFFTTPVGELVRNLLGGGSTKQDKYIKPYDVLQNAILHHITNRYGVDVSKLDPETLRQMAGDLDERSMQLSLTKEMLSAYQDELKAIQKSKSVPTIQDSNLRKQEPEDGGSYMDIAVDDEENIGSPYSPDTDPATEGMDPEQVEDRDPQRSNMQRTLTKGIVSNAVIPYLGSDIHVNESAIRSMVDPTDLEFDMGDLVVENSIKAFARAIPKAFMAVKDTISDEDITKQNFLTVIYDIASAGVDEAFRISNINPAIFGPEFADKVVEHIGAQIARRSADRASKMIIENEDTILMNLTQYPVTQLKRAVGEFLIQKAQVFNNAVAQYKDQNIEETRDYQMLLEKYQTPEAIPENMLEYLKGRMQEVSQAELITTQDITSLLVNIGVVLNEVEETTVDQGSVDQAGQKIFNLLQEFTDKVSVPGIQLMQIDDISKIITYIVDSMQQIKHMTGTDAETVLDEILINLNDVAGIK